MDDALWQRRGLRLEYLTLGWNAVGTVVVMAAAGMVIVFYGFREGFASWRGVINRHD